MNMLRLVGCVVALLTGFSSAKADDKVLVPGDPPLTQEVVDQYQERWQWYCDIQLTPEQRWQHTRHFITFWKQKGPAVTKPLLAAYGVTERVWREDLDLKGADQDRRRTAMRDRWMVVLRKSPDDLSNFMVAVYDAAYKPGGPKNPILIAGDPPLTQSLVVA